MVAFLGVNIYFSSEKLKEEKESILNKINILFNAEQASLNQSINARFSDLDSKISKSVINDMKDVEERLLTLLNNKLSDDREINSNNITRLNQKIESLKVNLEEFRGESKIFFAEIEKEKWKHVPVNTMFFSATIIQLCVKYDAHTWKIPDRLSEIITLMDDGVRIDNSRLSEFITIINSVPPIYEYLTAKIHSKM